MAERDWQSKVNDSQVAVEKAAALLLDHAEGLGLLAVMALSRTQAPDLREASLTPSLYLRDDGATWEHLFSHAAEDAHWETMRAAIAFAASREAASRRWGPPDLQRLRTREAVEDAVGPD